MPYVDGFVVPVPKRNLKTYRRLATQAGKIWREHGAVDYWECVADDVKPGKVTSFPQSVKLKSGETVLFSWIVFKSRAHRDQRQRQGRSPIRASPKMMDDKAMPFDGTRMIYGGFKSLVRLPQA